MNKHLLLLAVAGITAAVLSGCGESQATYVDPAGNRTLATVGQINIQDYNNAASQMVHSLLASGVLSKAPQQPAVMAISTIVNNTTQQIDTDLLVKNIRVALNQSGKVVTSTTTGVGGRAEDPLAQSATQMQDFMNDNQKPRIPDYTLSGKIIEQRTRTEEVRQAAFTFQLSLTDIRTGNAVWEDQKQIVKQGERPDASW